MRWPLRRQIMLPTAAIMLVTVLSLGGVAAVLALRASKSRIESQIGGVTRILQESNFPLTDAVLRQMKALSGAEMLLVDRVGKFISTSGEAREFMPLVFAARHIDEGHPMVSLGDRLWTKQGGYFHTAVALSGRRSSDSGRMLHIFYPEQDYRRAWQHAVYPSLAFVGLAVPAVMLLAGLTAARIGKRVSRLQRQVDQIAEGDFQQLSIADRDDELRALGLAVNRMAAMLASYEQEVRRTERMRTFAWLGGGIAHQLRNSATGCRIALDLHAEECTTAAQCECLGVAKTQLQLMDEYIQRFLRLGDGEQDRERAEIDIVELVDQLLPLVRPAAQHGGVSILWKSPADRLTVIGDATTLTQLLINLLINAIEAATQSTVQGQAAAFVSVELTAPSHESIRLTISDSGSGPAEAIGSRIFEPFVSSKADGVGIGLAVARDVARWHGGELDWERVAGVTKFFVLLPAANASNKAGVVESPEDVEMQCA
jgi:signal transduction histidine kinase